MTTSPKVPTRQPSPAGPVSPNRLVPKTSWFHKIVLMYKKITVALALAGALGAAGASVTVQEVNLGTLSNTLSYTHKGINGDFVDALNFKAGTYWLEIGFISRRRKIVAHKTGA